MPFEIPNWEDLSEDEQETAKRLVEETYGKDDDDE